MAAQGLPYVVRWSILTLLLIGVCSILPVEGKTVQNKALFLSSASTRRHTVAQKVHAASAESTRATFRDPVVPPRQPVATPLQSADSIATEEIQGADADPLADEEEGKLSNATPSIPPVMLTQILLLWRFVIILCLSAAAAVVFSVLYHQWSHNVMIEQQAVKLQFLVVLGLLIVCPASRATAASHYGRVFWILAFRNLLEMWLLLLVFCALPYMILDYLNCCCVVGAQKAALTNKPEFDSPTFQLPPHVRRMVGLPNTNGAPDKTKGLLVVSADQNWHAAMEVVRRLSKPMVILLAIRPLIQVVRCIVPMAFGQVEPWHLAAICAGVNLFLLSFAVAFGVWKLAPIMKSTSDSLGVMLIWTPLQVILATLLIAGQAQDLFFIVYFRGENLAQIYAGLLFMVEIVASLILAGLYVSSDPLVEMVRFRMPHTPVELLPWLRLIVEPYAMTLGRGLDPAVYLKKRHLAEALMPVYVQEDKSQVKRNIWRGVLLDIFANKVRSKLLAVVVVAMTMSHAVFFYSKFVKASDAVAHLFIPVAYHAIVAPGVKFVFGLVFAWFCWLACGIELLGNNIYYSKWWLLLSLTVSAMTIWNCSVEFVTATDHNPTLYSLADHWVSFFTGLLAMIALFENLKILLGEERSAAYYQMQSSSKQYARLMLEKIPSGTSKKHCDFAKDLTLTSSNPPSLMLVGTVATIPVVLSFALVMLYFGLQVIRSARIGQVYYNAFADPPNPAKSLAGFLVLDQNFDAKISPGEAGLSTVLGLLGPLGQKLVVPMNTLWASVSADGFGQLGVTTFVATRTSTLENDIVDEGEQVVRDGASRSLGQSELHSFLNIMYRCMALFKGLMHGDVAMASQSLVVALDQNKDGALDQKEFPTSEVALALQAVAPTFAHLVAPMLGEAWHAADTDQDEQLSIQELPNLLLQIKKRVMNLESAVQDLVLSLVLTGVSDFGMKRPEGPEPAPAPALPEDPEKPAPAPPGIAMINSGMSQFINDMGDDLSMIPGPKPHDMSMLEKADDMGDTDDLSMLEVAAHHHHKAAHSKHRHHHLTNRKHVEKESYVVRGRHHAEQSEVIVNPETKPSMTPSEKSVPAPAPASGPMPAAAPDEDMLGGMSFITKILMENTASLGEAFSLLLVAFDAILPDLTTVAEKLLTNIDGRSMSTQLMQVASTRVEEESALSSNNGWTQEDVVKMEAGLNQLMQTALPWLQAEAARAKVLLDALGKGVLVDSVVDEAFADLDTEPKDGKLNALELGLHGVLALVNPALAAHAPDLVSTSMGDDGLNKESFSDMLEYLMQVLSTYVGDVNGDGKSTEEDVKSLAQTTSRKLSALRGGPEKFAAERFGEKSLLQTWRPTMLRKVVRPDTDLLQTSSHAKSKIVTSTESPSSSSGKVAAFAKYLVQIFVDVNIDRIETALYLSALASFVFGVFVVVTPFVGQAQLYKKMQAGDKDYKGARNIDELKGRLDYASAYPGILFSTVLFGVLLIFFTSFAVLTALAVPAIYMPVLTGCKILIIWAVVTLVLLTVLKMLVLDRLCVQNGEIVHPRLFACVYMMLIVVNFSLGSLLALSRLASMFPFLFVKFHILSTTMLDGKSKNIGSDSGYGSYLAMVKHHHDTSNPLRHSFLQAIAPQADKLYGEEPCDVPRPQSIAQRTRNRFWVAYMMSQSPELRSLRKQNLASDSDAKLLKTV